LIELFLAASIFPPFSAIADLKQHCHYQGHVVNETNSFAAISLCQGVSGIVSINDELLVVQPLTEQSRSILLQVFIISSALTRSQFLFSSNHRVSSSRFNLHCFQMS
jgi:hypothetical protein